MSDKLDGIFKMIKISGAETAILHLSDCPDGQERLIFVAESDSDSIKFYKEALELLTNDQ